MCGIAGIFRFDHQAAQYNDLQIILDKLEHRGQDHQHIIIGANENLSPAISLGHRRLSIIDLNSSASQPMFYANKSLCLTYNGEIYNYRELRNFLEKKSYQFNTSSDTEVLLASYHYWGEDCVTHFNGMFAFALWDESKQRLFCGRDHVGIKPFYYIHTNNYFAFASEAQALTHLLNSALNHEATLSFLLSMYVPHHESIFESIYKLPPANTLTVTPDGHFKQKQYWEISTFETISYQEETIENLNQLIKQAIKRQIHSDVPVGGFLSGGIDSGLITALAAPEVSRFHTYSVGYEGMTNNELPYAKNLANRFATQHTELLITASDAMTYLDHALSKMSEPIADPASVATYMLAEIAAQDGVKVLLNGTGGDEVFSGYTRYTGQLSLKRKILLQLPSTIKNAIQYLPFNNKTKFRIKHTSLDMLFSTGGSYQLALRLSNKNVTKNLLRKLAYSFANDNLQIPLLYKQMLFDMKTYLPEELLFLLDQMTMAHTIEGRVPLLDIDVINYAFKFQATAHQQQATTKAILKKIALPYLGESYISRKKQGFAGSTQWWVKHNYQRFIETVAALNEIPSFNQFKIDTVIKNSNENEIFILYCLSKWWHKRVRSAC